MFADYHVHLDKMEWSIDTIKDLCKIASESGIDKVGLVVHTKALEGFQPLYSHVLADGKDHKKFKFDRDIEEYIELLNSAKNIGLPVKTGVEVCYSSQGDEFLRRKLKEYPFDYKIGSVHLIDGRHYKTALEYYKDCDKVGRMYYELILKAIESGLFNIIGHIEVARREGIPGLQNYPDLLEKICESLVHNNCAVEINTKWLTKHNQLIPDRETLNIMAKNGVRLVFGSDAHHIDRIGFAGDIAESEIAGAGYMGFSYIC